MGLPQLVVNYNRAKIARYGINIEELNSIIRAANVNMNIGRHFDVGEPLCEIVDKSNMMLRLTAYEKDLHNLKAGDSVVFRVNGIKGKTFRGAITMIEPLDRRLRPHIGAESPIPPGNVCNCSR